MTQTVAKPTSTDAVLQEASSVYGMKLERLSDDSPRVAHAEFNGGLRVAEVRPGSPAADEGVMSGDMLIRECMSGSRLRPIDWRTSCGPTRSTQMSSIKFYILRGNDLRQLPVIRR